MKKNYGNMRNIKKQKFIFLYSGFLYRAPKIENENPKMDLREGVRAPLFFIENF